MNSDETKEFLDPRISIIIPFFNSENTLERAINSVLKQDYLKWELILVNDGSVDTSEVVAKTFLSDDRIYYLYQENRGVCAARNRGVEKAKGDWVIFLDADDRLKEGILQLMSEETMLNRNSDFLVFGINRIIGKKNTIILPEEGVYIGKIPGTFLIRKIVFDQIGGYDERFKFSENTELFHRLVFAGTKGKNIPVISLDYFNNPLGGSKNLRNMVDSLTLFLKIHDSSLPDHVKHLYNQILGVNWMRFQNYPIARMHLWKAWIFKPYKLATLVRLGIAFFPPLARTLYKPEVRK